MTELTEFQRKLSALLPDVELRFEEALAKHTSFRIGGNAEVMAFPKTKEELADILKICAELNYKCAILGAGTNVLAPDEGVRGLVVCLKDCLGGMEPLPGNCIRVMAGVTMARAAVFAANHGLSGLEFAHGIPGTVGGGVYMNAGAYGGEMSGICRNVTLMDEAGQLREVNARELEFSYRHSKLQESGEIVISAVLQLQPAAPEEVKQKMRELQAKRLASQPLDYPSAGSAFKRPAGGYAAALIDQAGLRGFQVGQAAIARKHAGFAINLGGATAAEMRELLTQVSDRVFRQTGIRLEPEIRIW